jgi:hypothetical protein
MHEVLNPHTDTLNTKELASFAAVIVRESKERYMADNKNPKQKQPGEKEPGKYHFNPGNMSGKTSDSCKDESDQRANADRIKSRHPKQDQ